MLFAGIYFYAAAICTTIINDGGPGWALFADSVLRLLDRLQVHLDRSRQSRARDSARPLACHEIRRRQSTLLG